MTRPQHSKGKKRPRKWHRRINVGRKWERENRRLTNAQRRAQGGDTW